jgi:hypothetical protein
VTLDADFHAAIALSGESSPSAIRLRLQGLKGPEVARLLLDILSAREARLGRPDHRAARPPAGTQPPRGSEASLNGSINLSSEIESAEVVV